MQVSITPNNRVSIDMTPEEALQMIENLSKALLHANKVGAAYFCGPTIVGTTDGDFAGRITIHVEN